MWDGCRCVKVVVRIRFVCVEVRADWCVVDDQLRRPVRAKLSNRVSSCGNKKWWFRSRNRVIEFTTSVRISFLINIARESNPIAATLVSADTFFGGGSENILSIDLSLFTKSGPDHPFCIAFRRLLRFGSFRSN